MDYRYNINNPPMWAKYVGHNMSNKFPLTLWQKKQVADFALVRTKHEFMMEIASSHCEKSTELEVFPFTAMLPF